MYLQAYEYWVQKKCIVVNKKTVKLYLQHYNTDKTRSYQHTNYRHIKSDRKWKYIEQTIVSKRVTPLYLFQTDENSKGDFLLSF